MAWLSLWGVCAPNKLGWSTLPILTNDLETAVGRLFGIPFADSLNTLFVPGIAGRNLAAGLTTLALTYFAQAKQEAGSRRALGIFMVAWTLAGYSDCWILYNTPGSDNMGTHAFNIAVLTVTAFSLLRS